MSNTLLSIYFGGLGIVAMIQTLCLFSFPGEADAKILRTLVRRTIFWPIWLISLVAEILEL